MKSRIERGVMLITDSGMYEPTPIKRTRYALFAGRVFIVLCAAAGIFGALAAFNN